MEYEWFPRPPNTRERVIAGLLVLILVIAGASRFADWRLFGDHDKAVAGGMTLLTGIILIRFMQTVRRR